MAFLPVSLLCCLTLVVSAAELPLDALKPESAFPGLVERARLEHNEVSVTLKMRQWEMRYRGPEIVRAGDEVHADIEFTNLGEMSLSLLLWGAQPYILSATGEGMKFESGVPADGDTYVTVEPGETLRHRVELTRLLGTGRVRFGGKHGVFELSVAVRTGEWIVVDFPHRLNSAGAVKAPLCIMPSAEYDQLAAMERRVEAQRAAPRK